MYRENTVWYQIESGKGVRRCSRRQKRVTYYSNIRLDARLTRAREWYEEFNVAGASWPPLPLASFVCDCSHGNCKSVPLKPVTQLKTVQILPRTAVHVSILTPPLLFFKHNFDI